MPLSQISQPLRPSCSAILLGLCSWTRLRGSQSVLYCSTGGVNLSKTGDWGAPQAGYCGIPNGYGGVPHI
jgi:hypothetical protein